MDITGFKSRDRQHYGFYGNFVKAMFGSFVATALVLIVLALTLL